MILTSILFQIKVFLFIMSILTIIVDIFHTISVFKLEKGQLATTKGLVVFGAALSYVITMLICGF